MEEWDIKIVANKKRNVSLEELRRIAKKCGYKIIHEGETTEIHGIVTVKNKVGHPRKNISKDVILEMRKKGNTIETISKALGVSRSTVYNYLGKEYPKK